MSSLQFVFFCRGFPFSRLNFPSLNNPMQHKRANQRASTTQAAINATPVTMQNGNNNVFQCPIVKAELLWQPMKEETGDGRFGAAGGMASIGPQQGKSDDRWMARGRALLDDVWPWAALQRRCGDSTFFSAVGRRIRCCAGVSPGRRADSCGLLDQTCASCLHCLSTAVNR